MCRKFREVWSYHFWDTRADRHTDTLIATLRTLPEVVTTWLRSPVVWRDSDSCHCVCVERVDGAARGRVHRQWERRVLFAGQRRGREERDAERRDSATLRSASRAARRHETAAWQRRRTWRQVQGTTASLACIFTRKAVVPYESLQKSFKYF